MVELNEDVKLECEEKYGKVDIIKVDDNSLQGEIFIKFYSLEDSQRAMEGLNGRWFGGRTIEATYISAGEFRGRVNTS